MDEPPPKIQLGERLSTDRIRELAPQISERASAIIVEACLQEIIEEVIIDEKGVSIDLVFSQEPIGELASLGRGSR